MVPFTAAVVLVDAMIGYPAHPSAFVVLCSKCYQMFVTLCYFHVQLNLTQIRVYERVICTALYVYFKYVKYKYVPVDD